MHSTTTNYIYLSLFSRSKHGSQLCKKTKRRSYSEETFNEALNKIRSGEVTTKQCSISYHIPWTFKDHLKERKTDPVVEGGGRSAALSVSQENELANAIKTMSQNGFALSRTEFLDVVQNFVQRNSIKLNLKETGLERTDGWVSKRAMICQSWNHNRWSMAEKERQIHLLRMDSSIF